MATWRALFWFSILYFLLLEFELNIADSSLKVYGAVECFAGFMLSVNSPSVLTCRIVVGYAKITSSFSAWKKHPWYLICCFMESSVIPNSGT